jgi:hypothetical protein
METVEIKQLPPTINRRGAKYKLVKRGTKALIYARTVQGKTRSYEVFELKVRDPQIINGKPIPASERFPHDEAFGFWAWSYYSLEGALTRYKKLNS